MRICITAEGRDLEAQVDPRFGRCRYFVFVDTDTDKIDSIENPNKDGMGGVGIKSAQLIAGKQINVVLTGNVGPNASETLAAARIKVITGVYGTVKEVITRYKDGDIK